MGKRRIIWGYRFWLLSVSVLLLLTIADALTTEKLSSSPRLSTSSSTASPTRLPARRFRPPHQADEEYNNNNNGDDKSRQQQRRTDRPTLTQTETLGPRVVPSKPKIVVLGASGKIGRLVVRQLLESSSSLEDAPIVVAFVRDYDKVRAYFVTFAAVSRRTLFL
jgi:hypothetical protein